MPMSEEALLERDAQRNGISDKSYWTQYAISRLGAGRGKQRLKLGRKVLFTVASNAWMASLRTKKFSLAFLGVPWKIGS